MIMAKQDCTKDRLVVLERTVHVLNGQLRDMQCELQQARGGSIKERLWNNFLGPWQGAAFMSAVCNRRARPNTKVAHDDRTQTRH
jgi:hypothetical protein